MKDHRDSYFKKIIPYFFKGKEFGFAVAHTLFSIFKIDVGSNLLLKIIKVNSPKRILDLGCGTGRHTVALAKLGFEAHGIDQSPEALKIAQKQLKSKDLKGFLKEGDIYDTLPYADNYFDSVFAIQMVYHSTLWRINNLINEIHRVLKKEGSFFFSSAISVKYSMSINNGTCYIPIEPGTYFPLDGRERHMPHHYFTKEEIYRLLKGRFRIVDMYNDKENYYVTSCLKSK